VIPSNQSIKFGEALSYTLGPAQDDDDDIVTVEVAYQIDRAEDLIFFQESTNTFSISKGSTGPDDEGSY